RCALALREVLPECAIALVTGRGDVATGRPVGEAIDRGADLIALARPEIAIDEVTAGLLGPSFDVGGDARGLGVRTERAAAPPVRTLLGRPTPLIGRERELDALLDLFRECAVSSAARAVLVRGPAGVGKSRLAYELVRALGREETKIEVFAGRG